MKLISTDLTNLVSLEQSHHKPTGMYGGGPLKGTSLYITIQVFYGIAPMTQGL